MEVLMKVVKKIEAMPTVYQVLHSLYHRYMVFMWKHLPEKDYPNELMRYYRFKLSRGLDLTAPKRFTEKIQWRKIYDRDPAYTVLVDKCAAKKWAAKKIGA